jgi:hypothetical protein
LLLENGGNKTLAIFLNASGAFPRVVYHFSSAQLLCFFASEVLSSLAFGWGSLRLVEGFRNRKNVHHAKGNHSGNLLSLYSLAETYSFISRLMVSFV